MLSTISVRRLAPLSRVRGEMAVASPVGDALATSQKTSPTHCLRNCGSKTKGEIFQGKSVLVSRSGGVMDNQDKANK